MSASSFVTSMSIQNKSFLSATIVNKFSFNEIPSWHKITISAYPTPWTLRSPTWFVPSCNTIISTMDLKHERIFRNNKLAITSIYFLHGTKWRAFSANRHVLTVFRLSKVKEIICTVDNTGLAMSGFLQRGDPEEPEELTLKSSSTIKWLHQSSQQSGDQRLHPT